MHVGGHRTGDGTPQRTPSRRDVYVLTRGTLLKSSSVTRDRIKCSFLLTGVREGSRRWGVSS